MPVTRGGPSPSVRAMKQTILLEPISSAAMTSPCVARGRPNSHRVHGIHRRTSPSGWPAARACGFDNEPVGQAQVNGRDSRSRIFFSATSLGKHLERGRSDSTFRQAGRYFRLQAQIPPPFADAHGGGHFLGDGGVILEHVEQRATFARRIGADDERQIIEPLGLGFGQFMRPDCR